jgi:hypothetical protein
MEWIGVVYYLGGYALLLYVCAKANGGLGIADFVVCAVSAIAWPVILALLAIFWAFFSENGFTRKRWFTDKR